MHLPTDVVLVPYGQLLQLVGDVIDRAGVHVPILVDAVRGCRRRRQLLWGSSVGGIKPLEVAKHGVALPAAQLAHDPRWCTSRGMSTAMTALLPTARAVITAATATRVAVVAATSSLGGDIGRGLLSTTTTIVELHPLLEGDQLSEETPK